MAIKYTAASLYTPWKGVMKKNTAGRYPASVAFLSCRKFWNTPPLSSLGLKDPSDAEAEPHIPSLTVTTLHRNSSSCARPGQNSAAYSGCVQSAHAVAVSSQICRHRLQNLSWLSFVSLLVFFTFYCCTIPFRRILQSFIVFSLLSLSVCHLFLFSTRRKNLV